MCISHVVLQYSDSVELGSEHRFKIAESEALHTLAIQHMTTGISARGED